jgi:hypothetical protein
VLEPGLVTVQKKADLVEPGVLLLENTNTTVKKINTNLPQSIQLAVLNPRFPYLHQ